MHLCLTLLRAVFQVSVTTPFWRADVERKVQAGFEGSAKEGPSGSTPNSAPNVSKLRKCRIPRLILWVQRPRSCQARSGYLKHGLSTWARHCDGAIFWDENREEIAALDAQSALGEPEPLDFRPRPSGLSHRWIRTRRLWRHIFRNEVEHYDWFVSFDDGGFPIVENIRHLVRDMNPQNAVMMSDRDRSAGFGSFMSRGALKLLGEALDKNRQCPQPTRSQPLSSLQAYGTLWQCLHDATRRVAWDVELRHLLRCKEDDHSILNLKASTARGVCPYALFAFMVPEPTWLVDIHAAIYRDTQLKQTP
ncbi:unnamed protein product [Durusdinium trenchii]|uniref:Uncharacterized protein n=1 Tax=Durusdinium trenchii TaxID=1381693 RepID=A0ABP0J0V7_9DINO